MRKASLVGASIIIVASLWSGAQAQAIVLVQNATLLYNRPSIKDYLNVRYRQPNYCRCRVAHTRVHRRSAYVSSDVPVDVVVSRNPEYSGYDYTLYYHRPRPAFITNDSYVGTYPYWRNN